MKNAFATSGTSPTGETSLQPPPDLVHRKSSPQPDFVFQNHFSICLLQPLTPAGEEWFNEHLPVDNLETQFWGDSIVIEPRYADNILRGIHSDGLVVEVR